MIKRKLAWIFLILLLCFIALLQLNGRLLVVENSQETHFDAIFTFGGDTRRYTYTQELLALNSEAFWYLSDPIGFYSKKLTQDRDWKHQFATLQFAPNTFDEVEWLHKQLTEQDSIKVALVSSPWHMRRIQWLIERQEWNPGVRFYYQSVPENRFDFPSNFYDQWYLYPDLRKEMAKLLLYPLYYLFS